jgi:hypothetical protein
VAAEAYTELTQQAQVQVETPAVAAVAAEEDLMHLKMVNQVEAEDLVLLL